MRAGGPAPFKRRTSMLVVVAIAVTTAAVYAPVGQYGFVNYQDDDSVTENMAVRRGLSTDGMTWALAGTGQAIWHPLTSLSHMLDVELFGLHAGWHHRVNIGLHVLAALLLFAALRDMTGALWPSVYVAALFALHPLHVESVAWVSGRMDVLGGLLWMLTLVRYARYVRRPTGSRYLVLLFVFVLALLACPMVAPLPGVLLLLDVWPLRRIAPTRAAIGVGDWSPLLVEKVPLVVLAVAASLVTLIVQREAGAEATLASVSVAERVADTLVAAVTCLWKTFWPSRLAVLYPADLAPPLGWVAGALGVGVISALAFGQRHQRPYCLVGWLWFLGTLVPVVGLVGQGEPVRAPLQVPTTRCSTMRRRSVSSPTTPRHN